MTNGVKTEDKIERLVAPVLEAMGYCIVRVKIMGKRRQTLQIMAERQDGAGITLDACGEISRAVSALLDVEDPVAGSYDLEVSSPGIDRPLVRPIDFERFTGHEAKIETRYPLDGRKRFRGRLLGLSGDAVCIAMNGDQAQIPLDEIAGAKLVLTDELIAAANKMRHV